ncbi:phage integrase N-terminal SAM-like domain-containing protein [Herbaspirillum sp.]|uniref:phage integrase N-terminal SAM-like domain-containing protein n=1 Tax=Herbaspirillum sp. TaxID=1890675 RepID=UPI001B11FE02|nr:phage integrase N-terminal SAM-like domain-containing protein [Herbaspirillum sp.]MBO9538288.1 phage integrase N-terminal SAM-like domain-containing protein [Herbaspirillum sp.]
MVSHKQKQQRDMASDYLNTATSIAAQDPNSGFLWDLLHRVDRQQLADVAGMSLSAVNELLTPPATTPNTRNLDIELGGLNLRNINSDEDMNRAVHVLKALNLSPEAIAALIAGPKPVQVAPTPIPAPQTAPEPPTPEAGMTIQEMVPRFAARKKDKLRAKTLYEYGNYHRKFVAWLELRKSKKHIPIRSATRADIADYIDDLLASGLAAKTVSQKYLAAISGLFELAQSIGAIPSGELLVTHNHKVFTKLDAKKTASSKSYKPFTEEELKKVFQPELLSKAKQPADFWLPMMGLFTGGRVSELSQIDITDIKEYDGIWSVSINDEGDKQLKAPASIRLIPIHPTLIECGFLDYVKDASRHGTKLFPYLICGQFGSWSIRTGERWSKHMKFLKINGPQRGFHSFRSTSNICLKHNKVAEEDRCQFVGHEHDTVNSAIYSEPHRLPYLLEEVASKLSYPFLDFTKLQYKAGQFEEILAKECSLTARWLHREKVKKERAARKGK